MSKSMGNVISPEDILKNYGADILRVWASASDYSEDFVQVKAITSFSRNDFNIGTGQWRNTTILKDNIKLEANIFLIKE